MAKYHDDPAKAVWRDKYVWPTFAEAKVYGKGFIYGLLGDDPTLDQVAAQKAGVDPRRLIHVESSAQVIAGMPVKYRKGVLKTDMLDWMPHMNPGHTSGAYLDFCANGSNKMMKRLAIALLTSPGLYGKPVVINLSAGHEQDDHYVAHFCHNSKNRCLWLKNKYEDALFKLTGSWVSVKFVLLATYISKTGTRMDSAVIYPIDVSDFVGPVAVNARIKKLVGRDSAMRAVRFR